MRPARVTQEEFTLRDLLGDEELGLELVVGSEASMDRPISGAHNVEVDQPARWLDRDWVMLSTGLVLSSDPAQQRELIAELDEAGVAALGFGLDVVHPEVPEGLIEEATKREFPIFTVPHETPFRYVLSVVYRATLSSEIRASRRLVAMQTFLMDALADETPRSTVIERLASLISASVGLMLAGGEVMISTDTLPGRAIADRIRERPAEIVHFETEDTHGLAVAVGDPASPDTQWLVVASPIDKPLHALARPAMQVTVPVLVAIDRLDRAQRVQEAAMRRAIIERLLDVDNPYEAAAAATVAAANGLDIEEGVRVVVATDRESDLEPTLAAVSVQLKSTPVPFIGAVRDDQLVGIISEEALSDELLTDSFLQIHPTLRIGVGRAVSEPVNVSKSHADAVVAVQAVTSPSQAQGQIIHYDDLDLPTVLINELPRERLGPRIERWLEPVLDQAPLMETLVCYLRYDLDIGRTARALHLHPNSIRYRLARAEELLGARLRSPSTIVALEIALLTTRRDG